MTAGAPTMSHALARAVRGVRCTVCKATWSRAPSSSCPGVPLYRGWRLVPSTLRTRSAWRKERILVAEDVPPAGVVENALFDRYHLFTRDQGRALPARSQAAVEGAERGKISRRTCLRCSKVVERDEIVPRSEFWFYGEGIREDRVCVACYDRHWAACEEKRGQEVRDVWREALPHVAVFDFETTGLESCAVIEVGVFAWGEILYQTLVYPGEVHWEPGALEVHGIRPEEVRDTPTWPVVEREIGTILRDWDVLLLGSWSDFERRVLKFEGDRMGRTEPWPWVSRWFDVREVHDEITDFHGEVGPPMTRSEVRHSRRHRDRRGPRRASLARACQNFGVPPGCHRAAQDARATWELLATLIDPSPRVRCGACGGIGATGGSKRSICHRGGCLVRQVEDVSAQSMNERWWRHFAQVDVQVDVQAERDPMEIPF